MSAPAAIRLDRVVFYGRPLAEYERFFDLDLGALRGTTVLDCPSGASSFAAEAAGHDIRVTAVDPLFSREADELRTLGEADIAHAVGEAERLWEHYAATYRTPGQLRGERRRTLHRLCDDFAAHRTSGRYVPALLPHLPFADRAFDLVLSAHFLFIYDDRLDYAFHLAALLELARVSAGEVRVFPARRMNREPYLELDRLRRDLAHHGLVSDLRPSRTEFVRGWKDFLVLRCASAA